MLDATLLARLEAVRVLVLGDAMLDEYVEGDVERICPEAPVPVVRVARTFERPGGAANVALNARALGAACELAAVVGDDPAGARLAALCREAGLGTALLRRAAGRATTRKLRVLARRQQVLRMDWEQPDPLPAAEAAAVVRDLAAAARPDVLILSDYAKGGLVEDVLRPALARARHWGVPVVADPKSADLGRYRGATVLTPNRAEFAIAVGARPETVDPARIPALARPVLGALGLDGLVVTCGADGLVVVTPAGAQHVPATRRRLGDVTGAGDTVAAVLGVALGAGVDLGTAARLANLAAGLVVEKVGTATVTLAELRQAWDAHAAEKILSRAALADRLRAWRAAGHRVVFTNGCFDLLHAGHRALLRAARARGDALVVGLNSDRSVGRLKGPARPILAEGARAAMLAALDDVTAVVVFDEDSPLDLIREIRPHALVKGADYALDEVAGRDLVVGWGGEVLLVPLVPGVSTTALAARLGHGTVPPADA